jgi:hypothetical protein
MAPLFKIHSRIGHLGAAMALGASLAALFFMPIFSVDARVDTLFAAPAMDERDAVLEARITLRGYRSLWNKFTTGQSFAAQVENSLRHAVENAISKAGSNEMKGPGDDLKSWGRKLEAACEKSLSADVGGDWSARITPGFILSRGQISTRSIQ